MKRGTFFVMENEGRADPGFLVFLPGKPAIYLQMRRGKDGKQFMQGSTLRLRVSTSVGEGGGTVLVATFDDVMHRLRLEDVWMWRGEALATTQTFSRRREKLKEFVERHWVPDARLLGGVYTTIAQPISLEQFAKKGSELAGISSVEFIPEAPARRRLVVYLEAPVKAATGPAGMKQDSRAGVHVARPPAAPVATSPPPAAPAPPAATRKARALAVDKMPDVYDLYDDAGIPISRASVQQFSISQKIRNALEKNPAGVTVNAKWRAEFGGYEIVDLA
jgi:hypothetical protein